MEKKVTWVPALVLYCAVSGLDVVIGLRGLVGDVETADAWLILGVWLLINTIVFVSLLLFQCWKALPEAHRKTTPGMAVGFLFIPLFNFYWAFVSFLALAKGYYSYGKQVNDPEIKDMSGLGSAYAVLFSVVRYGNVVIGFAVGSLTPALTALMIVESIADVVVFVLFFKAMSTYANRALSRGASAPPPAPSSA